MSRYRQIHCLIWNDDKFPFLSPMAKLVFIHLLTTPYGTPFGLFKCSLNALIDESRIPEKGYREGFKEVLSKGMAYYNENHLLIYIPNFVKHNPPANPNVVKSWRKIFNELPNCNLKNDFLLAFTEYCEGLAKGFHKPFGEPCSNGMPNGMPNQEQEQEQEQEKDKGRPPCPYEKIIQEFNSRRGSLPEVKVLSSGRKDKIRIRWDEHPDLDYWIKIFDLAGKSEFMAKGGWASMDWIFSNDTNHIKIFEGNYSKGSQGGDQIDELKKRLGVV